MRVVDAQNELHERGADLERFNRCGELIAHGGLQACGGDPCEAVPVSLLLGRILDMRKAVEHAAARPGELVGEIEHHAAGLRELRAAAVSASHGLLHEGRSREVRKRIDRLPGGFVAHACTSRGLRNGSHVRNAAKDVDASVGLLGKNAGENGRVSGLFRHIGIQKTGCRGT